MMMMMMIVADNTVVYRPAQVGSSPVPSYRCCGPRRNNRLSYRRTTLSV